MKKIKIGYSDFWAGFDGNFFIYDILKKYFPIEISSDPDILFFSCYSNKHFRYNCHKVQFIGENQRPSFWYTDFAITFDYNDNPNHLRVPLYVGHFDKNYSQEEIFREKSDSEIDTIFNSKKKFCCFVVSSPLGKERNDFFNLLSKYKKVDSGGSLFNNIGYKVGDNSQGINYDAKREFVRDYKFIISFENSSYPGYTTEKILHAKQVDTIPIYWGNPRINEEMNNKSFLNYHDFNSFEVLMEKVIELDNNDELYKQYLKAPLFKNNQPNEYMSEERLVHFFEKVIQSLSTKPISKTLYYKTKLNASKLITRIKK